MMIIGTNQVISEYQADTHILYNLAEMCIILFKSFTSHCLKQIIVKKRLLLSSLLEIYVGLPLGIDIKGHHVTFTSYS